MNCIHWDKKQSLMLNSLIAAIEHELGYTNCFRLVYDKQGYTLVPTKSMQPYAKYITFSYEVLGYREMLAYLNGVLSGIQVMKNLV